MKILLLTFLVFVFASFSSDDYISSGYYDTNLVEITESDQYTMIKMSREGQRIRAKYFAAEDYNGRSVYTRYTEWARGRKTIALSSGTYMNRCEKYFNPKPVGLCIDNGKVVNRNLESEMDGLVIVYATGGIVVSNLDDRKLEVVWNGQPYAFNLRGDVRDLANFIRWAGEHDATVFQTHLLVYANEVQTNNAPWCTSCNEKRERRFLAVCYNEENKLDHLIVHSPSKETLHGATSNVNNFLLNFKDMNEVIFMINLDTGCQDVMMAWDEQGKVISTIKGRKPVSTAVNLLAYYYE